MDSLGGKHAMYLLAARRPILVLLALATLWSCDGLGPPTQNPNGPPPPDHPVNVKHDLLDLLKTAKQGNVSAVAQGLEKYLLDEADFKTLFGPKTSAVLWPTYRDGIAVDFKREAAQVFMERARAGLTEVTYHRNGPNNRAETNRGDEAVLDGMQTVHRMFSFRIARPGEALGLRLNGFVYVNGHWRALLKTGDTLRTMDR
ncbi:MAG: hypothetical protein VX589_12440 [Myxococcota bacterium]|nr:hypothetical protein [Myxococcota bacterium]